MMKKEKKSKPERRGGMIRPLTLCVPLIFTLLYGACARENHSFRHPEADLSAITRIAVIPFENFSTTQYAGEKVTIIYISELLSRIDVEVVEPGEVARVLQSDGISRRQLSQSEIKSLGSAMKADTLIFGTVQEYGTVRVRNQTYPVVAINVRWVDAQTGAIIFMGMVEEEGSPRVPIIDVGEEQLFSVLTRRACSRLVRMVR